MKSIYEKRYGAYANLDRTLNRLGLTGSYDMYEVCKRVYLEDAVRKAEHAELAFKVLIIMVPVLVGVVLWAILVI